MSHQRIWAVICAAGLAAAALTAPAAAGVPRIDYVALGDSQASGVAAGDYDPASGDCLRSANSYAALFAKQRKVGTFQHVACSGATTAEIPAQAAALNAGTDLVSVQIGGNDIGFGDVVAGCRFGTDEQCAGAVARSVNAIRTVLPGKLAETYRLIRAKAPRAQVVVLGYPHLFERGECVGDQIAEDRRVKINEGTDELVALLAAQAKAAHFDFADTRAAFAGHGVCSAANWIDGLRDPAVESYHPNRTGHARGFLPELLKAADFPV